MTGFARRALAAVSAHVLRVAGATAAALSGAVALLSLTTKHGLSVPASVAAASGTDVSVAALAAFASAHPAYPALAVVGIGLVLTGDDAPLLGS